MHVCSIVISIVCFGYMAFAFYKLIFKYNATFDAEVFELKHIALLLLMIVVLTFLWGLSKNETVEKERNNTVTEYDVSCKIGDIIVFAIRPEYDIVSAKGANSVELIEKHRTIIEVSENTPNEMEIIVKIKKKQ